MYGAPVFMSGDLIFVAMTQGTPLVCLALEARGLSSWDSQNLRTREFSADYHSADTN